MINLLLCTDNLELTSSFYRAVGVEVVSEKHGAGPQHFHFQDDITMEVYPTREPANASFVLRIDVDNVDDVVSYLKDQFSYEGLIYEEPKDLKTGRKSIVHDPDGRVVELFQAFKL